MAVVSEETPQPIRILIVDDHAILRIGLGIALSCEDDMQLVGEAENGSEAVLMCVELHPDVVLMDIRMPVMDGIEATALILQQFPAIRIIVLSSGLSEYTSDDALHAGACAYLHKSVSAAILTNTIREMVAA